MLYMYIRKGVVDDYVHDSVLWYFVSSKDDWQRDCR